MDDAMYLGVDVHVDLNVGVDHQLGWTGAGRTG